MKKTLRIIVSVCLLLSFLLSSVQAFALFEEYNYVSLGDSVTNGYGMDGYSSTVRGYKQRVPNTYPDLVAEELNADLDQLAFSGFRAEELHYVLNEDYMGDDYLYACFFDDPLFQRCGGGIEKLRREYKAAIEDADYITLHIGSNNIGTYLNMQLNRMLEGKAPFKFDRDAYANGTMTPEKRAELIKENGTEPLEGGTPAMIAYLLKCLAYTTEGFKMNFDAVVDIIYELNPDVNLIVVGMYNLMEGVTLTNDMINLGAVVRKYMEAVNDHMEKRSPHHEDYMYVDTMGCEIFGGFPTNVTDPEFFPGLSKDSGVCVHPNENGHKFMAERILSAIYVPFEDVDMDDEHYDAIKYAYSEGLMDEYSNKKFAPDKNATKGMIAKAVYVLSGSPEVDGEMLFRDVKKDNKYALAIDWAEEEGLITGVTSKYFLPNSAMSRQKVAEIFWKMSGEEESDYNFDGFYDKFLVSKKYKTAMAWAMENGLFEGITGTRFMSPTANVKRAELARMLQNYLEK